MESLNVLVVDDSMLTVKKNSAMLEELGHKVAGVARTGVEAIAEYEKCAPHIVAMDITMPDMDGIKATRSILEKFPEALIIMVTSHGQEKMVMDAIDAGAKGYIMKPFTREKLDETIRRVMEKFGQ